MTKNINFLNQIKRFNDMMQGGPVILYLGTGYQLDYPALAAKPWSCIYTSDRRKELALCFHTSTRQVRNITSIEEAKAEIKVLDKHNPMLIYLNGNEPRNLDEMDIDEQVDFEENQRMLLDTLSSLMNNSFSSLVIIGYRAGTPGELDMKKQFYPLLRKMGERSVYFYGVDEKTAADPYIQQLVKNQIAAVFQEDLGEALEQSRSNADDNIWDEDTATRIQRREDQRNAVYISGKVCRLDQNLCYEFSKYGRLLTMNEMDTGTISRMLMVEYFYKFLKKSPSEPQWYGYSPRNGFSVRREYEDVLYDMVSAALKDKRELKKPIILIGQTSSGKSIALASLAYRIFQERQYPIIFITNPDLTFFADSPGFIALDNLLQELERQGAGHVLIAWDCSVYNLQKNSSILQMLISCSNRGRKVIIVASAMGQNGDFDKRAWDDGRLRGQTQDYYIVDAPIHISPEERKALKNLIIEKGKLPRVQVERWMESNTHDDNLLSLLYTLIYWIHPQLEQGVNGEITKGIEYTKAQIVELPPPDRTKRELTSLAQQLINFGYVADPNEGETQNQDEWLQSLRDNLQNFSESLAVASQFKLRMPMTLAMRLLNIPTTSGNQRYRNIVFQAPWLICAMDDNEYTPGGYFVTFRTPIEAKIFLASCHIDERGQMKVVADIIRKLGDKENPYFSEEVLFVEQLIRMIGPNSEDSTVRNTRASYAEGCPDIIDALANLRQNGMVEPLLISQEITYIREYYGNDIQPLQVRVEWLNKAVQIARDILDDLKRPNEQSNYRLEGLINSITVESIFSELRLQRAYQELEPEGSQQEGEKIIIILYSFAERYTQLKNVIMSNPRNSYAYTALLSCFSTCYFDPSIPYDIKLKYLSQVLEITEEVNASIPEVEMNTDYQREKQKFNGIFDEVTGDNRVEQYFQQLLDMGSATGIHLKTHAMLKKANIDFLSPLSDNARAKCAEILSLLENEDYRDIVENNNACQYARLRLKWLYYNRQPIFSGQEQQLTCMNDSQWQEIRAICANFAGKILRNSTDVFYANTIYYLLALTYAQLRDYQAAEDAWNCISEGNFAHRGRNWVWHILCEANGTPRIFTGTLEKRYYNANKRSGKIYVKEMGSLVYYRNLPSLGKSTPSGTVDSLCIGTSYIGFTALAEKQGKWGVRG
ncbi:MAG TPA: hypothetical protein VN426_06015 [Syntrophomonadaceae bacterium]|nr:hypothetical protein [Syntrophomonadaceae bacterium]